MMCSMRRQKLSPATLLSVMLAGLLTLAGGASPAQAQDARLSARIAALEAQLARLTTALDNAAAAPRAVEATPAIPPAPGGVGQAVAIQNVAVSAAPAIDRFTLAALNLQAVLLAGRPYQRELQVMRDLAPQGILPPPLAETLLSHASRGLATPADLREGFSALAPLLTVRSPASEGWQDWAMGLGRRLMAWFGLVDPPPPVPVEATIANASHLLARGQLAAALADLETLDPALQPLLAGWRAQARARVAAEQALQETILRALGRAAPG